MLAACSMAPKYEVPPVPLAEQYKEAAGHPEWTPASPADGLDRGSWWRLYGDATLDALAQKLEQNSPNLAAALARYEQAAAYRDVGRAPLFPRVSANGQALPTHDSDMRPPAGAVNSDYDNASLGLQASYELDFWGRVRNAVTAADAGFEAAGAELESAHLSLRAQLVDQFVLLRAYDIELQLLSDTVAAYQRALDLTGTRHANGVGTGLDVARARNLLQSAKAQRSTTSAQREAVEHAIAALVGESPSSFRLEPETTRLPLPEVPVGLPSTLLQRRPDIAAAERRTAAANAAVGVARAAWFPAFTLGGSLGYQSYERTDWFKASNLFWSIGPSLALELLDGGRRQAQLKQARAALDEAGAVYRGTVLQAFVQVEDNLALLDRYRHAADEQAGALDAARKAVEYATVRYRNGAVNYLEVTTAQTAELQAEREALRIATSRLRASVALIRALGGGWSSTPQT